MGREKGEGYKREGTHVYLWPIHVDVWQKLSQYCNYLTIKNKIKLKKIRICLSLANNDLKFKVQNCNYFSTNLIDKYLIIE